MLERYETIVIGGGHAGTEAAWAAASVLAHAHGRDAHARGGDSAGRVALITMDPSRIGQMSCNPAIGGLGKGQIVREIDALGGIMGRAIDATGIMFKMLNTSKGAAVRGPRAQADKYAYAAEVQRLIATRDNIDVIAGTVDDIIVEGGRVVGVIVPAGAGVVHADREAIRRNELNEGAARPIYPQEPCAVSRSTAPRMLRSSAVILTTGTFARGLMHTGERKTEGGRIGEGAAVGISATLRNLGFELGRLKTGTPPRLARETIDWDALAIQRGDDEPVPFSDLTWQESFSSPARFPKLPQIECRMTHTTAQIHEIIRANIHRAPMFSGQVEAECGPRYCPSIEDKVVRFEQRDSHHVFLEPESLHTNEIYCNGISTSLPTDVQEKIVRLLSGCERAKILKWGYAVEYDMVWPHQIDATCMAKHIRGLFLAGQINCTTGYEEAGGQGLIAGLNAARLVMNDDLVRIARDEGYIGVMMDDLVTKPPREPYRMFTSRAEYRLRLRADNADERLTPLARDLGLVDDHRWSLYQQRAAQLDMIRDRFQTVIIDGKRLREIARRPNMSAADIIPHLRLSLPSTENGDSSHFPIRPVEANGFVSHGQNARATIHENGNCPHLRRLVERVVTEAKYDGYIERQTAEIKRQKESDRQRIPDWIDYRVVKGLRSEAAETLAKFRPATMGQAARLPGVNPADLTIIAVAIRRGPAQPATF